STTFPAADMAALRDGDASAQASVSNVNGNSATTTHAYSVDASAPTVTINTIAGDDIINAAEHGQALVISGSSTGGEAGDVVTVTLNSKTYTTALDASGNWSVGVPAVDVSAWPAGTVTITASGSTTAGNPVSVTHPVTVDLTAVAV
ncbi:Ig-like domain-containing protein, partial [Escherichia coli]|uniref:Ig-like domain-containing protein n=1 Tax=Escherichia coli TaxID=562 RepID=UPI001C700C12|nr:Ig-like domain-containing protein [Escherichia coli]